MKAPLVKTRKVKKIYTFGIHARTEKSQKILIKLWQWFLKTDFLKWHFESFVAENIQRMKVLNGGNYSLKDCFGRKEFQIKILAKCKFLKIEIASSTIVQGVPAFRDFTIRNPRNFVIIFKHQFCEFPSISWFWWKKIMKYCFLCFLFFFQNF